jgi:hypothetical protein
VTAPIYTVAALEDNWKCDSGLEDTCMQGVRNSLGVGSGLVFSSSLGSAYD